MQRNCRVAILFSIVVWIVGFVCASKPAAAKETEVLKITVGKPTLLDPLNYQNAASISGSRTGVVAAFYPTPPKHYRTSSDGGVTWGPPMNSPRQLGGGTSSGTLRDGGVIKYLTTADETIGEAEERVRPMVGKYKDGWFILHSTFAWFNDDFTSYEVAPIQVYMPDAVTTKQKHISVSSWPIFERGNILHLANGDLLAPMYGLFKGDTRSRVVLSVSSDRGHKWRYYATVATGATDPNPELPGQYNGPCEPSIELLPNGQMISVFRTQYSHYSGEYRPMSVSWSDDHGRTWTTPIPTRPHLMAIAPKLIVLENGVVAVEYGRPGFHVAFSIDNGHTWQDRVSLSHLPEPNITGQFDMARAGPNKLVAIGNDGGGTKVWPIEVQRVTVSPAHANLEGRVLDQQSNPIVGAKVELGPNRYAAEDWLEHPTELDPWKATPLTIGSPVLGYRSINKGKGYPTVQTDAQGTYRFDSVKLGEYVLTVEAESYAPQHRHIKVGPEAKPQVFQLKAGRRVRSRVVDSTGRPVPGACVVLNGWHIHTDRDGFFHWSVEDPLPAQVEVNVYRRYAGHYGTFKKTLSLSSIERQPIILSGKR
jgi:protocatechuate 3,4-dioxygenase beta subunit